MFSMITFVRGLVLMVTPEVRVVKTSQVVIWIQFDMIHNLVWVLVVVVKYVHQKMVQEVLVVLPFLVVPTDEVVTVLVLYVQVVMVWPEPA